MCRPQLNWKINKSSLLLKWKYIRYFPGRFVDMVHAYSSQIIQKYKTWSDAAYGGQHLKYLICDMVYFFSKMDYFWSTICRAACNINYNTEVLECGCSLSLNNPHPLPPVVHSGARASRVTHACWRWVLVPLRSSDRGDTLYWTGSVMKLDRKLMAAKCDICVSMMTVWKHAKVLLMTTIIVN